MKDAQAERVLLAVLELATVVRDEGPDAIGAAAEAVLKAAGGDAIAALIVAAANVAVDQPVNAWWAQTQHPYEVPRCGTERGYRAHLRRGERACVSCRTEHNTETRRRRLAKERRHDLALVSA